MQTKGKRVKQTAIRDKMLQISQLQLSALKDYELASLMLALPVKHPLYFDVFEEVERRRVEAFNKIPDNEKEEFLNCMLQRIDDNFPLIDALARSSDAQVADSIIGQLSEKRGRLN